MKLEEMGKEGTVRGKLWAIMGCGEGSRECSSIKLMTAHVTTENKGCKLLINEKLLELIREHKFGVQHFVGRPKISAWDRVSQIFCRRNKNCIRRNKRRNKKRIEDSKSMVDSEIDRAAMASTFGEGTDSSLVVRMNMQVNVLISHLLKEIYEKFNSDSFKPVNVMAWNFPVQFESKGSPGAIDNNSNTPGRDYQG